MIRFPAFVSGPDVSVSASSFMAYGTCPEMALARFRGVYGPESLAGFRGSLAHRVFARHLRDGPIESDAFGLVCREEIGASNLNHKVSALGLKPSSLRATIAEVGELYQRFRRLPGEGFADAEAELEVLPAPGVRLVGVVDAVFDDSGSIRIVDWKTGAVGEASRQLAFYSLLWAEVHGSLPALAEAVSVGTGERCEVSPDMAGMTAVAAEVAAMVNRIRVALDTESDLETRAGPWCEYCPLLNDCSDGRAAVWVKKPSGKGFGDG